MIVDWLWEFIVYTIEMHITYYLLYLLVRSVVFFCYFILLVSRHFISLPVSELTWMLVHGGCTRIGVVPHGS